MGEDNKIAEEESTQIIYHQDDRQGYRIRHSRFDIELWILLLMGIPSSGKLCIILQSQFTSNDLS